MILVGLFLVGTLLVLVAGALADDTPRDDGAFLDALLFLLVLVGVLAHRAHKKQREDEDEE